MVHWERSTLMFKNVMAVGLDFPGGEVEEVEFYETRSALDADVVLFEPQVPFVEYEGDTYLGKTCLNDDRSFRAKEALAHWKRELAAALEAGKLIVVFLPPTQVVYAATGEVRVSGTGRNAQRTRIVGKISNYDCLPVEVGARDASGTGISLAPSGKLLSSYWRELGPRSRYRAYLTVDGLQKLCVTTAGNRVVGAIHQHKKGALLFLPDLGFDDRSLYTESTGGVTGTAWEWTQEAIDLGRTVVSQLLNLHRQISDEQQEAPPPDWALDVAYSLPRESELMDEVRKLSEAIADLDAQRQEQEAKLSAAGSLRRLLYDQGKPLESAVREALQILGFKVSTVNDGSSEFDAVFEADGIRLIGEVEGKDAKPINIQKFSQLERNLAEDFAREDAAEYAKGVLFGNAFRSLPPDARGEAFTEKCLSGARRLGIALVRTADLFGPARYLSEYDDPDYAKACRVAIASASGELANLPPPPSRNGSPEATESDKE